MRRLLVLLSLSFSLNCSALYFVLRNGEAQCLHLDQPAQTEVVVGYRLLNSGTNIRAVVEQSDSKTPLFDRALPVSGDHFEFTTAADGLTMVCLSNEGTGMAKLEASVSYGQDMQYYQELAKREGMDDVSIDVTMLNDEMRMILKEADYMKNKEVEYHQETETRHSAAHWWPMIQLVILIITGIIQVNYLKTFFKKNKLI